MAWLAVFVLLGIAEVRGLVWLADGAPGDSGLATFSVVAIVCARAALIVAPTLYFLVPLALPLDFMPHGLKQALVPKLSDQRGRGFVKLLFSELEGALDRAAEQAGNAASLPADPATRPATQVPPDDPLGQRG